MLIMELLMGMLLLGILIGGYVFFLEAVLHIKFEETKLGVWLKSKIEYKPSSDAQNNGDTL